MRPLLLAALALIALLAPAAPARAQLVILDAGHGGDDTGAVGVAEVDEKELTLRTTLALAERLRAALPGATVVLTRDDDAYPTLEERAALANRLRPALFVSVHYNAAVNPLAEGIETFWLDPRGTVPGESVPGRDEDDLALPRRDVAVVGDVARVVLDDLVRDGAMRRSARAAEEVHAALIRRTRAPDRGVRQAQFRVLRGVRSPAIVVELGFLTHAREGRRVLEDAYHERLLDGLEQGIVAFLALDAEHRASYEAGAAVAASPGSADDDGE